MQRIIFGENINNIVPLKRLNIKSYGDIIYECKCGLCGKEIRRTELKLRLLTAVPCAKCCKKYGISHIPQVEVNENNVNTIED